MTRLILFLLLFSAAVLALASVLNLLNPAGHRPAPQKGDTMPATFRTVAYILLLVLMVGVATGWLGAVNG
jgi:cell division protein FtsX